MKNFFTFAKIGSLLGVTAVGLFAARNASAWKADFAHMWTAHGFTPVAPGLSPETGFGLFVAVCVAQAGSLFAADAWHGITFTAGEVTNPRRNLPLSLLLGTLLVIGLFLCANVAYLLVLPFRAVQQAASDRVAAAILAGVFPTAGADLMAVAIMISAFGCMNGILLSGARAYYAMAKDNLFFRRAAVLNGAHVPGSSLAMQGAWAAVLVLIRTYNPVSGEYGNLFRNLLDYVVSAALLFYILTIAGLFRLRIVRPDVVRPYRAFGYPFIPVLYLLGAAAIFAVLSVYRPYVTLPGLVIVLLGVPVYFGFRPSAATSRFQSQ